MKFFNVAKLSVLASGFLLFNCTDEEPGRNEKVKIQFATSQSVVEENSGAVTVRLLLSQPSANGGVIYISFDANHSNQFSSNPQASGGVIEIPVVKNASSIEVVVTPTDNADIDRDRTITFSVSEVAGDFMIGEQVQHLLVIKDDESLQSQKESFVNFVDGDLTLLENSTETQNISISLSEAGVSGTITLAVSGNALNGTHFETIPALENGRLVIDVQPNATTATFGVKLLDNAVISGETNINFKIESTTGQLRKGTVLEQPVLIKDDELVNKFKGYVQSAGGWTFKRNFEYTASGKIAKVLWESYTPGMTSGVDTYFYDENDRLIKINKYPQQDVLFTYEGDHIVKEERIDNGVLKSFIDYDWDENGNMAGFQVTHRQPDESYRVSSIVVFLYFNDGNLYKKLVYVPSEDPENPYLTSTTTFDHYITGESPMPIVQVLPGVVTQKNLPTTYRYEVPGFDFLYNISYEYDDDGRVISRTAVQGSTSESVTYSYY